MTARAKFRSRKEWTPTHTRRAAIAAGVVVAAFLIGYGITALSFNSDGGIDVITVPDVRQMPLDDARREIERSELELVLGDSFPNAETPAGAILAQSPLPGQEVSPGSEVQVFVSTGAARPTVPTVEGMPLALATRALQTAGFDVMVQDTPGIGDRGRIVGTEPPPGSALQLPATVRLWVSSGAPSIAMPSVIGMLETAAHASVEAAGLTVGDVDYETNAFGEPGGVVGQEPAPGDSVQLGTEIRLRVISPGPQVDFDDDPAGRNGFGDADRNGDGDGDGDGDGNADRDRR